MRGEKGERRRQELLKIAYRLFSEKGYNNTSIEEIIEAAGIAKGTYYYHFPSKQATLEAVVDMILTEQVARAREVVASPLPVPQKLVMIIYSMRPQQSETKIADAVEEKENIILHDKLNRRIISEAVPLLAQVVREGISQGLFACEQVEERVRMILIMSVQMFDNSSFTENDITVFIDLVEKTVGAKAGTMGFIRELIN